MSKLTKKTTLGKSKRLMTEKLSAGRKSASTKSSIGGKPDKKLPSATIPPWRTAVYGAVQAFDTLCGDYEEAKEGYRAALYKFAERCYKVGRCFSGRMDQYARFKEDPFWSNVMQKPNDDKIMRAVLVYATKSNAGAFGSLVTKIAKVLDDPVVQNEPAGKIAELIKSEGGIEKMYAKLSPSLKTDSRIPDDLEMLDPDRAEEVDDGIEDESEKGDANSREQGKRKLPWWLDPTSSLFDGLTSSQGQTSPQEQAATARASGDEKESAGFEVAATLPATRSRPVKINLARDLIIDLSDANITPEDAFNMGRLLIAAEVGLADAEGWRPCKALRVEYAPDMSETSSRGNGAKRKDNDVCDVDNDDDGEEFLIKDDDDV